MPFVPFSSIKIFTSSVPSMKLKTNHFPSTTANTLYHVLYLQVGYTCREDLKEPFLEYVNSLFCSLMREYVKRRDNNFKFVLSTVEGILNKEALLSEVKSELSCQWSWKEEDKITFTLARPSLSVSEVRFCYQ